MQVHIIRKRFLEKFGTGDRELALPTHMNDGAHEEAHKALPKISIPPTRCVCVCVCVC